MERHYTNSSTHSLTVTFNGRTQEIPSQGLELITGAKYAPYLEFTNYTLVRKVLSFKRNKLCAQRLWLSAYFKKDVLGGLLPAVSLNYIDHKMGWGVFAKKEIHSMEFIAEYSGLVRKRGRNDSKNSYCFEYLLNPDEETPYLIDAQNQGGISRYINHHPKPNLSSAFVLIDHIPHIILYTSRTIVKGEQLFYDYGLDYWKKRPPPFF